MGAVTRHLLFLSLLLLIACGGGGDGLQGGPPVAPLEDGSGGPQDPGPFTATTKGEEVTALIGPEGGSLVATDEGNRFTLTLPPGALEEETTISLAPVTLSGLGFEVLYAVRCQPSGTEFIVPGELTIELADGADPSGLVPFTMVDSGTRLSLLLGRIEGNRLTVPVQHFSFFGYAGALGAIESWTDSVIADPNLPPPSEEETLTNSLAGLILHDPSQQGGPAVQNLLSDHFNNSLLPFMDAASTSDDRLVVFRALRRYLHFLQAVAWFEGNIQPFEPIAQPRLVALLKRMLRLEAERMVRANNIDHMPKILRWYEMAQLLNLDTPENGLDLDSITAALPIKLVTRPDGAHGNGPHPDEEHFGTYPNANTALGLIPFPKILDQGEEKLLDLTCGYQLGDNQPMSDQVVRMSARLEGGDPDSRGNLETIPGQRTTSAPVDGVVEVVMAPQFSGHAGTLSSPFLIKLADNSDGINIIVDASLYVKKRFTLRVEGKLFMQPLQGPTTMSVGSTATVRVPLLRKGTKRLAGKEVEFSVTGGGSLSPDPVVTDSNGVAEVQYTAPSTAGQNVTIEASYVDGDQTVRESLTIAILPPQLAPSWSGPHTGVSSQFNNNPPIPGPPGTANLTLQFGNEFQGGRTISGGTLTFANDQGNVYRTVVITGGTFTYGSRGLQLNCRVEPFNPFSLIGSIRATLSADEANLDGDYEEVIQTLISRIVFRSTFQLTRN